VVPLSDPPSAARTDGEYVDDVIALVADRIFAAIEAGNAATVATI
jgi:hypothetical protein